MGSMHRSTQEWRRVDREALNKPVIPNASEESGGWATPRASIDAPRAARPLAHARGDTVQSFLSAMPMLQATTSFDAVGCQFIVERDVSSRGEADSAFRTDAAISCRVDADPCRARTCVISNGSSLKARSIASDSVERIHWFL